MFAACHPVRYWFSFLLLSHLGHLGLDAAPLTVENARWNVNVETRHEPKHYRGSWPNHSYFPSPEDWRSLSIYQLITDRFSDGDPRNNEGKHGGFDVRDMTSRHGGDFVGVTQKLPYIQGLGCRGIWISPVFQNGYNSYHQYSQLDFTLLDQRLGTKAELRRLTQEAHRLGLYVIVDVVMNHMSNEFFFEGHRESRAPWRFHEDKEYHLRPRRPVEELHWTPAGRQPYMDFWYNNTWDPDGTYPGTVYGQHGEAREDEGRGTYSSSDFHHNGDLQDYYDPFQIHYGKLYGTMDDLRLEHQRVQAKYIAMTNALISSCDVDGFRVDTPMQVPLVFYKAWVPAVRKHAASLGKKSFGIFGEFYVTPERYATMTGRGRDRAMYGTDQFIEGPPTMNGGIVYSYYWYMFTAFVYGKPQYADGFALAFEEESNMLDTYDEASGQKRYAMWNFCNNHDNWRMQSMTSTQHFFVCLVIITFWPGIPLHYAGDEQNFRTPGSALDGWAREELGASLAWQSVRHQDNVLERDNFDMTSRNYLFIARLNALRRSYFGDFGAEECDELTTWSHLQDVVAFIRGCSKDRKVLVMANFNAQEAKRAEVQSHWTQGVLLQDTVERVDPWNVTVGVDGHVAVIVPAMSAYVFAPNPRPLPPMVRKVVPAHGSLLQSGGRQVELRLSFDRAMDSSVADLVELDGHAGLFSCLEENCAQVGASLLAETFCRGLHVISAPAGLKDTMGGAMTAGFRSTFVVDPHSGALAQPKIHARAGLICDGGQKLCHNAAGAQWLRIRDVSGNWTAWRPYESQSEWTAVSGIGVLVQYHAEGSSSYVVGDCLLRSLLRCHSSWHHRMNLRGDFNDWGSEPDVTMRKVAHFTWAANLSTDTFFKAKFVPGSGWSQSYGVHPTRRLLYGLPLFDPRSRDFEVDPYRSGAEASRKWMVERGFWSRHESVATTADFASDIWIAPGCTPEPPPCPPPPSGEDDWKCHGYRKGENLDWCHSVGTIGCVTYALQNHSSEMSTCGQCDCCHKPVTLIPKAERQTCCVLFNDLLLNYTITPDLSRCQTMEVELAPSWILQSGTIYEGLQGRCDALALAGEKTSQQEKGLDQAEERNDSACSSTEKDVPLALLATLVAGLLLLILLYCHSCSRLYLSVVRQAKSAGAQVAAPDPELLAVAHKEPESSRHVLFASIEHCVPQRGVNAFTGDTGRFLQDFIEEHPAGKLSMVHPMLGIDYGPLDLYSEVTIVVDGKIQVVEVLMMEDTREGLEIRWYFLRHELFSDRTQESLFPQPMSKIRSLRFYSLWNQALAMLLDGLKPQIYHCLDCHQALAPLYTEHPIPLVLLLRNPSFMGCVEADIGDRFWKTVSQMRRMSLVFNLKIRTIRKYCLFEGRFNLLRAGIRYAVETQGAEGLCVLSSSTAGQLRREHRLLQSRHLSALGHPSRLKVRKAEEIESLKKQRDEARRNLQHHGGLVEDAEAKVLLFVGPWAQHAGVEEIAEVLPQILCRHEKAQVLLCGLCSDLFGVMAQDLLCRVMSAFPGRLCFLSERFELADELRRGVDFLLAPYLSEPIGQSDVEMGFLGVPTVGCAEGALGRMPGVYFHQQNSSREMLTNGFFFAVDYALTMSSEEYWQLAKAATEATATEASFGALWQQNLRKVYDDVQQSFVGRQEREDQEHFDDRLWNNAASQEELRCAMAPRRSSALRPISSTADLAHQMQVLDIDDDAEFLAQPVSESRAQEIMKAVAESLPYLNDQMDASDLQRDISQARQRLQERSHMTRGLMKPFARGLCLRIHLVMAICYITSSVGELLLQTLQVDKEMQEDAMASMPAFQELWLAFYVALSIGSLLWLILSYGIPPNLLMTASQGLNLLAFLLLPLLPDHCHEANWSYIAFVAMSGVQSSSKLLFILWNFNEDLERGFEVAIWRFGVLEASRRAVAYLALLATYAGKLWIYKQVHFIISFTSLVLLFKAPYCYATHVLPSTGLQRLGCSFWLLLLAEVLTSLASYSQDAHGWLAMNGWSFEEMQLLMLAVIIALPLILHTTFGQLRRMQVWGPWALRDLACFLPSGALLRVVALYDSTGHSRSPFFLAALLMSVLMDTMRHCALLSATMTVLGSRWNALKGCYLLLCLSAAAMAMSPWLTRSVAGSRVAERVAEEWDESLDKGLWEALWALPLAVLGYVFQASASWFFNREVLTFKGPRGSGDARGDSVRWLWVSQVKRRIRGAKAKLWKLQDRAQEEELALDQVQAVIEESFSLPSLLSPKGGKILWDSPKNQVLPMEADCDDCQPMVADEQLPGEDVWLDDPSCLLDLKGKVQSGLPPKDSLVSRSAVSFTKTELPAPSVAEESQEDKEEVTTVSAPSFDITPMAQDVPEGPVVPLDAKDALAQDDHDQEEDPQVVSDASPSASVLMEREELEEPVRDTLSEAGPEVLLERSIQEDDRPANQDAQDAGPISLDEAVPKDTPQAEDALAMRL